MALRSSTRPVGRPLRPSLASGRCGTWYFPSDLLPAATISTALAVCPNGRVRGYFLGADTASARAMTLQVLRPHYDSGLGGFLLYFASYFSANLASSSGWQMKHCESGRSCLVHQSPSALNLAASFGLHWAQISSGTPCSSHHQPS